MKTFYGGYMKIGSEKVVSIDYTLKDSEGSILDSSEGKEPLSFIYGNGSIIRGLENELEGKEKGDSFSVSVEPKDGYGEYDESMMFEVGKEQFQNSAEIEKGMQVQAQNSEGQVQILTVMDVEEDKVILDANHPLAGKVLHFDVAVTEVREASKEELDHGHVH